MMTLPKIATVFGASTPKAGTPDYEVARCLGGLLAQAGWAVATGGYSGVMEAASRGAAEAGGHVIGVTSVVIENWRTDTRANSWIKEEIKFATLRERLYHLVDCCHAAIALPGGIGTLSEIAFTWSLLQTDEIKRKPLVLIGPMWGEIVSTFIREAGVYLHPGDQDLIRAVGSVEEAIDAIQPRP
jgi:uncharacterized protein (TIGR00730 family)